MATFIFKLKPGHGLSGDQVRKLEKKIDGFLTGLEAAGGKVVGTAGKQPGFEGADRKWKVVSEKDGVWQVELL